MQIDQKTSISVFFPCYNDEKSIRVLIKNAFKLLRKVAGRFEVIVVDDGSTDNSRIILQKLAKKYQKLKLFYHHKNLGYGAALKSGFAKAKYELVFYTDGDGQYDVFELPILLNLMTNDVDFVNGIKMSRNDPTYRIFIGNFYSFMMRWLFWIPIYDVDGDFRLIRKKLLDKINLKSSSGSVCVELIKQAQQKKATFRQVSIHHYERKFGNSQFFRPDRITKTLTELLLLWINLILLKNFLRR